MAKKPPKKTDAGHPGKGKPGAEPGHWVTITHGPGGYRHLYLRGERGKETPEQRRANDQAIHQGAGGGEHGQRALAAHRAGEAGHAPAAEHKQGFALKSGQAHTGQGRMFGTFALKDKPAHSGTTGKLFGAGHAAHEAPKVEAQKAKPKSLRERVSAHAGAALAGAPRQATSGGPRAAGAAFRAHTERKAVSEYGGVKGFDVNSSLRFHPDQGTKDYAARLDSAIRARTADKNQIVYRGLRHDPFAKGGVRPRPGDVFADHAFASTSRSRDQARQFGGKALLRVKVPKGSKALDLDATLGEKREQETLLPLHARFKVKSVKTATTRNGPTTVYNVDYLGPGTGHEMPARAQKWNRRFDKSARDPLRTPDAARTARVLAAARAGATAKPPERFGLAPQSAHGTKPTTFASTGSGTTRPMIDIKTGDLPGQASMFDKGKARPIRSRPLPDRVTVHADTARLHASLAKDKSYYVGPGGTGAAKPGAYANVKAFKGKGDQPRVGLHAGEAHVSDGRHRLALAAEQGRKTVAVSVDRSEAGAFHRRFGVGGEAGPRKPGAAFRTAAEAAQSRRRGLKGTPRDRARASESLWEQRRVEREALAAGTELGDNGQKRVYLDRLREQIGADRGVFHRATQRLERRGKASIFRLDDPRQAREHESYPTQSGEDRHIGYFGGRGSGTTSPFKARQAQADAGAATLRQQAAAHAAAKAPAPKSLREQAAEHRAGKGDREARLKSLMERHLTVGKPATYSGRKQVNASLGKGYSARQSLVISQATKGGKEYDIHRDDYVASESAPGGLMKDKSHLGRFGSLKEAQAAVRKGAKDKIAARGSRIASGVLKHLKSST